MDNYYIFIIWNKALWCKNRILSDLSNSFDIVSKKTIVWNKDNFKDNLMSLYGHKLGPADEKIKPCGNGPFYIILIKDKNPNFINANLYDGIENVNYNVLQKKLLYRKWTAGCHRIHCSINQKETKHDLVVLFGNDYNDVLGSHNNIIYTDTKSVYGFFGLDDLIDAINNFDLDSIIINKEELFVFTKCRYDLITFLKCNEISKNKYQIKLENIVINFYIFGELDGDLPVGFFSNSETSNLLANYISSTQNRYLSYLENGKNGKPFDNIFKKFKLESKFTNNYYIRNAKNNPLIHIFNELKLFLIKFNSFIHNY